MMAADVRHAVLSVDAVEQVTVRLQDHFASAEVEAGVNRGKRFSEAFPEEAYEDLDDLRLVFFRKGYTRRQEHLLRCLREAGFSFAEIALST